MRWFAPGRAVALLFGAAAVAAVAALVTTIVLAANGGSSSGDSGYSVTGFRADYRLQRDGDRTVLAVTETIDADFYGSRKHGLYRSLPTTFNGHSTAVSDISVSRNDSTEETLITQGSNAVTIRIGSAYSTVEDAQTYVIRYLYHDVVQDFGDQQESTGTSTASSGTSA